MRCVRQRRGAWAREIRLLIAPVLGDWAKVLQLSVLMFAFGIVIALLTVAAHLAAPSAEIGHLFQESLNLLTGSKPA